MDRSMQTPMPDLAPLSMLSDEQVVERVLAGDTPVFELLMRRHNRRLFRVAVAVVRSADEAEDVVQESYVRAFEHLSRFEGRASVVTWLSRITFHEALRRRRRRGPVGMEAGGGVEREASARVSEEDRMLLTAALD